MCRSKSEVSGGRICPGCRGKKHRARQRAYYNASDVEEQYENSARHDEGVDDPQESAVESFTMEQVWSTPLEELKEYRESIREDIKIAIQDAQEKYHGIEYKMLQKISGVDENNVHLESGMVIDKEDILKKKDMLIRQYNWNYRQIFQDKDDFLQNDILDYEESVRKVGAFSDAATMITMREMMEEEGFTEENFNTPGVIQDIAAKYDKDIEDVVFRTRRLEQRLQQEKKDDKSVRSRIASGESIDQQEFYEYLKETYADSRDEDGNLYMDESDITAHVFRAIDVAYQESDSDKTWKQFRYSELGRKKFGEDQYGSDIQIPKSAQAQKIVLEMFDTSRVFLGDYGLDNKVKSMVSGNINTIMNEFYGRAYREESNQSFGNSEVPVVYQNYNNKNDTYSVIKDSMSVYPDSLIEKSQKHHMPLSVQLKKWDRLGNPARPFFKDKVEVTVRLDSPLLFSFDSFDDGYLEASSSPDIIKTMDNLHKNGTFNDQVYEKMMEDKFARVDDKESVSNLDTLIDKKNKDYENGQYDEDGDIFAQLGVNVSNDRIRIKKEEFVDALGVRRYKVVSDNNFSIKTKKIVSQLSTNGTHDSTIHEFGHYLEAVPQVNIACKSFLYRRTQGFYSMLYMDADATNDHSEEKVVVDGFFNNYVGKDYSDSYNTEVFSMGAECIFGKMSRDYNARTGKNESLRDYIVCDFEGDYHQGDNPLIAKFSIKKPEKIDLEHKNLILGLFSTIEKD